VKKIVEAGYDAMAEQGFDNRLDDNAETWLGVEMFSGSNTPEKNRDHLEIVTDDLVTMHEPDPATFHRVLTRR
jgi:hypothetical protein